MKQWLILSLLLLIAACATTPLPDDRQCERLHARLAFCLLTPGEMQMRLERLDRVRVETDAGSHDFIGQLRISEDGFLMVGQSLTGMALFRIDWDGDTLNSRGQLPEAMGAKRLLGLMQLMLAEPDAANGMLYGGRLEAHATGDRSLRLDNGRPLLHIRGLGDEEMIRFYIDGERRITLEPL